MGLFTGIAAAATPGPIRGVVDSAELRRIRALPRRRWDAADDLADLTAALTDDLAVVGACGINRISIRDVVCPDCQSPLRLRPMQAAALRDAHDVHGALLSLPVGEGKTLVAALLPTVMDWSQRPLLFVPGRMREQLAGDLERLRRHWRIRPDLQWRTYDDLSNTKDLLETLAPDLIAADEAHTFANFGTARTRRFNEYMSRHKCEFVPLSGTMLRHSIKDAWKASCWALRKDLSPLPWTYNEATDWANALDEFDDAARPGVRLRPGALLGLCDDAEQAEVATTPARALDVARRAFFRRMAETPGVIMGDPQALDCTLRLERLTDPKTPKGLTVLADKVAAEWELPTGELIMEASALAKHLRNIAWGFYYRLDPPPPREWADARREWGYHVRERVRSGRAGVDSESACMDVIDAGRDPVGATLLARWRAVRGTYDEDAHRVAVWVDDLPVRRLDVWRVPTVWWVDSIALGRKFAEVHRMPYLGAGAKDSKRIDTMEAQPIVASIQAHGEGKNLQDRWSEAVVLTPPSGGATWEQLLGRLHRQGQKADLVRYRVALHAEPFRKAMRDALRDAAFFEAASRQKLTYAEGDIR